MATPFLSLVQPCPNRSPPQPARWLLTPALAALVLAPGPVLYAASVAAHRAAALVASVVAALPLWVVAAAAVAAVAHAAATPAVAEARRLRASLAEHSETLAGIDRGLAVRQGKREREREDGFCCSARPPPTPFLSFPSPAM